MGKRRQPPKLLSRVIRAVAGLKAQNGSTINHIVVQVRKELTTLGGLPRNMAIQVRRALKYAVEIGALMHRSGKYKMATRRKIIPIDSLELAIDYLRSKKRHKKRTKTQKKVKFRGIQKHSRLRRYHKGRKALKDMSSSTKTYRHQQRTRQARKNKKTSPVSPAKKQNLLEKKVEPPPSTAASEGQGLPSDHRIPSPHDQSSNLDRRPKRYQTGTEPNQTPYPEYKDSMKGDDRKSLDKVPDKPRRPRRPILPCRKDENNKNGTKPDPGAQEDNVRKGSSESVKLCKGHSRRRRRRTKSRQRKHQEEDLEPMDSD